MERFALALLPVALLVPVACGGENFANTNRSAQQNDAGDPEAAADAAVITGVAPPGCDGAKLPTEDPCVIFEGLGVFVSSSLGTDTADGSRTAPLKSLQKAIDAAKASGRRVYACAEPYAESIALASGVSLFGYFDCKKEWAIAAGKRAEIKPTTSPAVKASALTTPVRIESVQIVAPAGATPGASSIGVLVADSNAELRFVNARIEAKSGAAGAPADTTAPPRPALKNSTAINGGNNVLTVKCGSAPALCRASHQPGKGGTNDCGQPAGSPYAGGPGGNGGLAARGTYAGGTFTLVESPYSGGGGTPGTAAGGVPGTTGGASGANGADGVPGVSSSGGTLTAAGFIAGDGTGGTDGVPGQGGGGSGAAVLFPFEPTSDGTWYGTTGVGGGAGGCPGLAGPAGRGGGASIALLSWNSVVVLQVGEIQAADGGAGTPGSTGSPPTEGGQPGASQADPVLHGHLVAGAGSWGTVSGTSGHGAGGPSLGVAYKGAAPQLGDVVPIIGAGGNGVDKVAFYSPTQGTRIIEASAKGQAATVYAIP